MTFFVEARHWREIHIQISRLYTIMYKSTLLMVTAAVSFSMGKVLAVALAVILLQNSLWVD
jgi:hypothetical protein